MKNAISIAVMGLVVLTIITTVQGATDEFLVRGQITDLGTQQFTWDSTNFGGLFYDMDGNIGAEQITFRLANVDLGFGSATLSDEDLGTGSRGAIYTTRAQVKNFRFKPWGGYYIIGFMGEGHLAAYSDQITAEMKAAGETGVPLLYDKSEERNLMMKEELCRVLVDSSAEQTITSLLPLKLQEGYELSLKNFDSQSGKVYLELSKNGQVVDRNIIQPSIDGAKISDKTYIYRKDFGEVKGIVVIAVHFKNALPGSTTNIATIDGVFQISDVTTPIKSGQKYDMMSIRSVNPSDFTINMDNKDNQLVLSKDTDAVLMQNINVKTADQDATAASPLRYYIYRKLTTPGRYEIRGAVANLGMNTHLWDPMTFAGFYYDLDKNIGNEQLNFTISNVNPALATLSDQPNSNNMRGVVYTTTAQAKNFKFKPWGQYRIIGFLGEGYFAAYSNDITFGMTNAGVDIPYIYDKSKNRNLMSKEQLSKVLIDDNKEQIIKKGGSLMLKEGYELALKGIDDKGHLHVELLKNGQSIDIKVVQPSIDNAMMADKTYYYKTDLGDVKEIVTVGVHFKNSYRDEEQAFATVDGIWQISDTPLSFKANKQYDKMSIRSVDSTALAITMDNKDNQIMLTKNKNVTLMKDIYLRTANQDIIDEATPLRYYIYTPVTIQSETANEGTSAASSTMPENNTTPIELIPSSNAVDAGI